MEEKSKDQTKMAEAAPSKYKFRIRPVYLIGIIVVIIAIAIAGYSTLTPAAQSTVSAGDNISVYYTGSYTNGTVFSTNYGAQPLNFTVGANEVIPGFDNAVLGMRMNETKNVTIPDTEAYGPVNPQLIVFVPITQFGNQSVNVGTAVSTSTGEHGVIIAKNATNVTVDFNPPLAGRTLVFKIKILAISK